MKLETFSAKLLSQVTKIVDEKLSGHTSVPQANGAQYADKAREPPSPALASPALASAPAAQPIDFASVLKSTKNEEIVEEQERQRRVNNMIVYGISEAQEDENVPLKTQDDSFIKKFMAVLEVDVVPSAVIRIGKPEAGKNRPVKIAMASTNDKEKIMSSLTKLKDADEVFRRLSVRDDYTKQERELVKKFVADANEKNKAENTTAWKVRGTPKKGLRLVKITKR